MSTISSSGQYAALIVHNTTLQERINELSQQSTTYKKTTVYSGLNSDAKTTITLRNSLNEMSAYKDNVSTAQLRINTMQTAMNRMNDIVTSLRKNLIQANQSATPNPSILNSLASQDFDEMVSLLNSQADGKYIFAGSDVNNPPVINAQTY